MDMVKKSEEKSSNKETTEVKNAINLWVNNSNEFLKMWGDSNLKLFKPWMEFNGENSMKISDMAMNTSPLKYKEFYEEWMKTYKSTYGKISSAEILSPEEALEGFVKCANESNKLYLSWIEEFGENSKRTAEVLNNGHDPAKYRECFNSWKNTYEKVIDGINEHPALKFQRDFFESYSGMPDLYSESIAKMAKQIKEIQTRLYDQSDESITKFSDGIEKLSKGDVNPETYKEFYDVWLNNYKDNFSKLFDPQTMKPSKELLDDIKQSTEITINLFKSWTEALEKLSEKMEDQAKLNNDPEAFKEFYSLWVKMFERTSEDILEGVPLASPIKEMMEPVKSACKTYTDTSIKMSRMWMDSFSHMAPKV